MPNLRPEDFSSVSTLVEQVSFNRLFALSVVNGLAAGQVWVDDTRNPAFIHIVHSYGMSLLVALDPGGDFSSLEQHLTECRRTGSGLWLQVWPQAFSENLDALFAVRGNAETHTVSIARFTRANFRFDPSLYAIRGPGKNGATGGVSLRPMVAAEFGLDGITVSPHMFWRSAEDFLSNGGGWCVMMCNEVSSIGFTSFRIGSQLELGVETRPEHRGKGHGRIACAAMIDQCLDWGLEPVWSCRKENLASYHLAQSLGFVPSFEGAYYHLPAIARCAQA